MTKSGLSCEDARMAAWARLDGESTSLAAADIDGHVSVCAECRAAIAGFERLNRNLARLEYEALDVDVWARLEPAIVAPSRLETANERRGLGGLIAVLFVWRLAQLLIDLPAPVVNSIVPLACIVFVLWRLTGDPFAIRVSPHHFRQESAS